MSVSVKGTPEPSKAHLVMTMVLCIEDWLLTLRVYTDNMSTDSEKQVDGQSKLERALAVVEAGDLLKSEERLRVLRDEWHTEGH